MNTTVKVRAELILEKLAEKYYDSNSSRLQSCRFAKYDTHYSIIFKTRNYCITTTIKLSLDFKLIGVYSFIPETSLPRIKDPVDAKRCVNARYQDFADSIVFPALEKAGMAA